jgi:uncharacterized protein YaiI (UPF0178 family)
MGKLNPNIYVDGDACPFKEEIYRVAKRYDLTVFMVCNSVQRIPKASWIKPIVVGSGFDAVDDWIAEQVEENDIVITNDLLLAHRCLQKLTKVLDTRGREHTPDSIGEALATRELMSDLRAMGELNLGPKKLTPKYRSQFLGKLDEIINRIKRGT